MVLMDLLSNDNGIIRYSYRPETSGENPYYSDGEKNPYYHAAHGILRYDSNTGTPEIELLAEKDVESTFYRNHAFRFIRDNITNPPQKQLLAWY
jgi:hypothetical protein